MAKIFRRWLRKRVQSVSAGLGIRVVSSTWGPRGFRAAFARLKTKGFKPREVADVGAANGQWTTECLTVFPDARYLLCDPLPANVERLEELCRRHSNCRAWSGAIGAENGSVQMHLHGDQSSIHVASDATLRATESIAVPLRTLDSFLDDGTLTAPDLIKADVQGHELEVLRGATRCLSHARAVLLEVSFRRLYEGVPLAHEVIAHMGTAGFRIEDFCSYLQRERDDALIQSDMLFVAASMWGADEDRYY